MLYFPRFRGYIIHISTGLLGLGGHGTLLPSCHHISDFDDNTRPMSYIIQYWKALWGQVIDYISSCLSFTGRQVIFTLEMAVILSQAIRFSFVRTDARISTIWVCDIREIAPVFAYFHFLGFRQAASLFTFFIGIVYFGFSPLVSQEVFRFTYFS